MKNLTINYRKEWGNDGTVYDQTITTNIKITKQFNKYVDELKKEASKKFIYNNTDMKILYYLEPLRIGKNYTNLTTLDYFKTFYVQKIYIKNAPKRDKDIERILYRNTIIKVL